jgi:hypothetical protein
MQKSQIYIGSCHFVPPLLFAVDLVEQFENASPFSPGQCPEHGRQLFHRTMPPGMEAEHNGEHFLKEMDQWAGHWFRLLF